MKKLAIIAMALVLTASMAACGTRNTTDTTTTPSTAPSTTTATTPTTQATSPAATTGKNTEPTNSNGAVGDVIDDITGNGNSATDANGSKGRGRNNAANMQ